MKKPKAADWPEIRRRIDAVRATVERASAGAPEDERRVLKIRAQVLAQELETDAADADTLEVVEFELAGEHYAFPLTDVREVSLLRELTPVPCTPPFVLGIINLRGEIRTVIDLKKFFDLPEAGITELNQVILIKHDDLQLGILADAIRGVRRIALADLQPTLPTLTDIRADYLRGVTSERLVVLDATKLLSDQRLLVQEEAGD